MARTSRMWLVKTSPSISSTIKVVEIIGRHLPHDNKCYYKLFFSTLPLVKLLNTPNLIAVRPPVHLFFAKNETNCSFRSLDNLHHREEKESFLIKNANQRLAFCPDFLLWLAFCPSQFLVGILSGPSHMFSYLVRIMKNVVI